MHSDGGRVSGGERICAKGLALGVCVCVCGGGGHLVDEAAVVKAAASVQKNPLGFKQGRKFRPRRKPLGTGIGSRNQSSLTVRPRTNPPFPRSFTGIPDVARGQESDIADSHVAGIICLLQM